MSDSTVRAKPGNLVMSEAVPHCQQWVYHCDHSIEDMLSEGYFRSVKDMLRTGDMLRLVQIADDRVQRTVQLMIVAGGRSAGGVEFQVMGEIQNFPDPSEVGLHVKRGQRCFKAMNGDEMVKEFNTKAEAQAHIESLVA